MVLTREAGKNGKLLALLAARGVAAMELPLVETAAGPDREALPGVLTAGGFEWAVITSPEAAAVFLEGWRAADCPQARLRPQRSSLRGCVTCESSPCSWRQRWLVLCCRPPSRGSPARTF